MSFPFPRTVFEAFGHTPECTIWVETPDSWHLEPSNPCSCNGIDTDPLPDEDGLDA